MAQRTDRLTLDQMLNTPVAERTPQAHERTSVVMPIVCQDGTSLSVQASRTHYCWPRENEAGWYQVEVGYPSATPPADWQQYEDGAGSSIYGYVPIELVRAFIQEHGGEAPIA